MTDNQNETKTDNQDETKTVVDLKGVGQKAHEANEVRDRITGIHQAGVPQTADVEEREQVAQEAGKIFKEMGGKIPAAATENSTPPQSPGGPALPTPPPLSVSSSVPSQADVKSK